MFKDRVVFITGGASGLGRILVEEFADEGAKVFFTYRSHKQNAQCIEEKYGPQVQSIQADAADYEQSQLAIDMCVERFGALHILINNAASVQDGSIETITQYGFDYTIKNVLYSVFNYTKAAIEPMKVQNYGKIITIGSINGLRGREGSLAYSTAKAGIIGFNKTVAKELGKYNINCNVVAPGYIATDGQIKTSEIIKKVVLDECAIRKLTEPVEVANLILFLAGNKSDNITGQTYKIDCGQYI